MALRKGLFVSLVAVGLAKGLLPLDSAAEESVPTASLQSRTLRSPAVDVAGDALSALIAATACPDQRLAAMARAVNEAALVAAGRRPANDMARQAQALVDSQPALRKALAANCTQTLKEAEARLDRHGR